MSQALDLPTLNKDASNVIPHITQILTRLGLHIIPSFDLQNVHSDRIDCRCPNHGTDRCDCQMVVMLIYGKDAAPTTLVVHGHDGKTHLSIVDNPQQRSEPGLSKLICRALLANAYS